MIATLAQVLCCSLIPPGALPPGMAGEPANGGADVAGTRRSPPSEIEDFTFTGTTKGGWQTSNALSGLAVQLGSQGLEVSCTASGVTDEPLRLALSSWGRGSTQACLEEGAIEARGNQLFVRREAITEWYVNEARGLEQGFTVQYPPPASPGDDLLPITLVIDVLDETAVTILPGRRDVRFSRGPERTSFLYTGLRAWDAEGCELTARFEDEGGQLRILVDDRNAVYPVTIDPWIWTETAKLVGSHVGLSHAMGKSLSIDGDTALIGAPGDQHAGLNSGSSYVYVKSGTTWVQQARLTSSDANTFDYFGWSVSLSGDTALVGSWGANGAVANTGAAYVFTRTGTTWTEQAKLTSTNGAASDQFGYSVALDGDTAVIGAHFHDPGSLPKAGVAYVFDRSGTTWSETAQLSASDAARDADFGLSVSLQGTTAVVGAPLSTAAGGGAYVYQGVGTTWTEQAKLDASDGEAQNYFGAAVDLAGNTILVGASNHTHLGHPTSMGTGYVFVQSGTTWTQQAELFPSDGAAFDGAGTAVAIDGDLLLLGAFRHAALGSYAGATYAYHRLAATWTEHAKLQPAGLGAGDQFGAALSMQSNTAVIGAPGDDDGGSNGGAVFVYDLTSPASATFRNDVGNNNSTGYSADPPALGAAWTASVDNSITGSTLAWVMGYADPAEFYLPATSSFVLVDPSSPGGEILLLPVAAGTGLVTFGALVPSDPALLGITLSTQGVGFGGAPGPTLHNAYDLFVGN